MEVLEHLWILLKTSRRSTVLLKSCMKYRMKSRKLFSISFGLIPLNQTVSLEYTPITWEIPHRQATSLNSGLIVWRVSSPRTTSTWSSVPMSVWWMDSRDSLGEHLLLSSLPLTIVESTRTLELFWFWRPTTRSFLRWSILPTAMRTIGLRMKSSWEGDLRLHQDGGKDIDLHGFILKLQIVMLAY